MIPPSPRRAALVVGVVALLLAVTACSASTTPDRSAVVVGATPGVPAAVVADIYRQVLRSAGATVFDDTTVGDYGQLLDGVDGGRVSMFGAFDGDLLSRLAPSSTATSPDDVYTDLNRALPQGVSVGDPTTVSDQVQVVVTASLASSSGADALSECARLPAGLP
ncbi:MAG: glycine/betaine ABC transporter substrate-binding protein, partial [Williamsia herbipolensis]|nr:glycine/betaine ABC transporter substrate-binding protein [Williamsia herbipolensis]